MSKLSINHLTAYHPYYKNIINNPTRTFGYAKDFFYLLYYWNNLLAAFLLAYDSSVYTMKPSLIT